MNSDFKLGLSIADSVPDVARQRIRYAFRLFCAVYGFQPVENESHDGPRLCYGSLPSRSNDISITAGYVPRDPMKPAPPPAPLKLDHDVFPASEKRFLFPVFHGSDENGSPDWLGEIFEWVSGAHEYSIKKNDTIGRVPYESTLHCQYDLDPCIPYASIAMHGINYEIQKVAGSNWPKYPNKPWNEQHSFAMVATHDIDFLPLSRVSIFQRFIQNLGGAAIEYRDPRLVFSILYSGIRALLGRSFLQNCLELLYAKERKLGIDSTFTVICRREHSRDANYEISDPMVGAILDRLITAGFKIGVHGSYTSLESRGRLAREYRRLANLGYSPVGGRQHWLRYNGSLLYKELSEVGAWYDCSSGYADRPGFRHGACFPFPPYDFESESPFPLLELPLAMMDKALYKSDPIGHSWNLQCQQIKSTAKTYGWGGISILWHDTSFGGVQYPEGIGEAYWQMKEPDDWWTSGETMVEKIWPRYASVGLLPSTLPTPCIMDSDSNEID